MVYTNLVFYPQQSSTNQTDYIYRFYPFQKFHKNFNFWVILLSDKETNKQTEAKITSLVQTHI